MPMLHHKQIRVSRRAYICIAVGMRPTLIWRGAGKAGQRENSRSILTSQQLFDNMHLTDARFEPDQSTRTHCKLP
jgi:hypothetical protein